MTRVTSIKTCLLTLLFTALACAAPAFAIQAELSSKELFPGDAFSIKISGLSPSDRITTAINGLQIPLDKCGEDCLVGVGIVPPETAPGKLTIDLDDGDSLSKAVIAVKQPLYPEIHLTLPDKRVSLSPQDLARARDEEQMLTDLWQIRSEKLYKGAFIMPLPNRISAIFGAKRIINKKTLSVHRGIDIKGALGEEVKASNRGRVVITDELFFGGNTIVLDHGLGIYTVYMHLDSFRAKKGAIVEKGEVIGLVGSSGRSTGPHLHLGLKILTFNANPVSLIGLGLE